MFWDCQKWRLVWIEQRIHSTKEKQNVCTNRAWLNVIIYLCIIACPSFFPFLCSSKKSGAAEISSGGKFCSCVCGSEGTSSGDREAPGVSRQMVWAGGMLSPAEPGMLQELGRVTATTRRIPREFPGTAEFAAPHKVTELVQPSLKARITCRDSRSDKFVAVFPPYMFSWSLWTFCFPNNSLSS